MFNDVVTFFSDLSHLAIPFTTNLVISFAVGVSNLVEVQRLRHKQRIIIKLSFFYHFSSIPEHEYFNFSEHRNLLLDVFGLLRILDSLKSVRNNANEQVEDHHIHAYSDTKVNHNVEF